MQFSQVPSSPIPNSPDIPAQLPIPGPLLPASPVPALNRAPAIGQVDPKRIYDYLVACISSDNKESISQCCQNLENLPISMLAQVLIEKPQGGHCILGWCMQNTAIFQMMLDVYQCVQNSNLAYLAEILKQSDTSPYSCLWLATASYHPEILENTIRLYLSISDINPEVLCAALVKKQGEVKSCLQLSTQSPNPKIFTVMLELYRHAPDEVLATVLQVDAEGDSCLWRAIDSQSIAKMSGVLSLYARIDVENLTGLLESYGTNLPNPTLENIITIMKDQNNGFSTQYLNGFLDWFRQENVLNLDYKQALVDDLEGYISERRTKRV